MKLIYMAHAYGGDPENLRKAKAWLAYASKLAWPDAFVIAPWISHCEAHPDADAATIERGLRGDCEVVRRCDEIWLCGDTISPGMKRELSAAQDAGKPWAWLAYALASNETPTKARGDTCR